MSLIIIWTLYALLGIGLFAAFFLWGVRTRQFEDQNRARYLPLETMED